MEEEDEDGCIEKDKEENEDEDDTLQRLVWGGGL